MTIVSKQLLITSALFSMLTLTNAYGQQQPAAVPEFLQGLLMGYLPKQAIPNSLKLLPPPRRQDRPQHWRGERHSQRSEERPS